MKKMIPKLARLKPKEKMIMKPKDFKTIMDKNLVGQEELKQTLSLAITEHLHKYVNNPDGIHENKPNVCIIGNTGTGKTKAIEVISDIIHHNTSLSVYMFSTPNFSQAGYKGVNLNSIADTIHREGNINNKNSREHAIVFLDEIDKVMEMSDEQMTLIPELLPILQGTALESEDNILNTHNILFIGAGVFNGARHLAEKEEQGAGMGFNADLTGAGEALGQVSITNSHLLKSGFPAELLGRMPLLCQTEDMTEETMSLILENKILPNYRDKYLRQGALLRMSKSF